MTATVLFSGSDADWADYEAPLTRALSRLDCDVSLSRDHPASATDYIVIGGDSPIKDFTPYAGSKAILRLWAGVNDIVRNETISIPIARMVGGGLDEGMVEWVTAHVLRHHIGMDAHILGQDGQWRDAIPPLACDRPVTILGLGALGTACGEALVRLGFPVTGWSQSEKSIKGIRCLNGPVEDALADAQIVVLLLPLTPETKAVLNESTLAKPAKGAIIINPGRGPLIDDNALLAALDSDQIGHATLDTFRVEPLPPENPFWSHPKVTVTPHIASATRPDKAADVIAENVRRGEAGEPFLYLVDIAKGY